MIEERLVSIDWQNNPTLGRVSDGHGAICPLVIDCTQQGPLWILSRLNATGLTASLGMHGMHTRMYRATISD